MFATFKNVSENPEYYFANVLKSKEQLIVDSENGNLIIIPEEEWNQMNETLKLLLDKISLTSLLEGQNARMNDTELRKYSIEEVFDVL